MRALALALLCFATNASAAELPGWLAGHWRTQPDANGVVTDEVWLPPAQGNMIGMSRTIGGRSVFFEYVRLEVEGKDVYFIAQPKGVPPTKFKRVPSGDPDVYLFENTAHDFPQRVRYAKVSDDEIEGRIEGTVDGKPRSETWRYRRAAE